jgi:hypothetical protein
VELYNTNVWAYYKKDISVNHDVDQWQRTQGVVCSHLAMKVIDNENPNISKTGFEVSTPCSIGPRALSLKNPDIEAIE